MSIDPVVFDAKAHIEMLRKHVVTLVADSDALGNHTVYSGFVVEFKGQLLWCSAGHCLEEGINVYMASGDASFRFNPLSEKHGPGVPFSPASATIRYLNCQALDFGFIVLNDLYAQSLLKAGVKTISLESIAYTSNIEGTYVLIGVPAETVVLGEIVEFGQIMEFVPIAIGMTRLPDDETSDGSPRMNFSFSRKSQVIRGVELESVVGMSGSPIFLWAKDRAGADIHIPIGIQYGWEKTSETIRAVPMTLLKIALEFGTSQADS